MKDQHNNMVNESLIDYVKGKSLKELEPYKFDSFFDHKYDNELAFYDVFENTITDYMMFLGENIMYYSKDEMKKFLNGITNEILDHYDDEWEPI